MPTPAKWTVLAYLAGDNNLDSFGALDLNEMKAVGSNADLSLVAQFDRAGAREKTSRYYLRKGTRLAADVVESFDETNMGDPKVLDSFLRWGIKNYPADHYLVILWNHGAGWDDTNVYRGGRGPLAVRGLGTLNVSRRDEVAGPPKRGARSVPESQLNALSQRGFHRSLFSTTLTQAVRQRGIAYDDQARDFLDNIEVKKVLAGVAKTLKRKIDILGMDACLMNMVEVAYQVKDCCAYTVGSEELEPGDGWPYTDVLRDLAKKPSMSAAELGAVIVNRYIASYGTRENVTLSALDLAKIEPLKVAVDLLGTALKAALANSAEKAALAQARQQVQHFDTKEYVDLIDLCQLLKSNSGSPGVKQACDAVLAAARPGALIVEAKAKGTKVTHANGVSLYFPIDDISPLYATLDFAKKGGWDEFLGAYAAALQTR